MDHHTPNGKTSVFFGKLTENIIRYRWLWLVAVLLVTGFFITQAKHVRYDNSSDIWFVQEHESILNKAIFDDLFGNDDYVSVFFHHPDGFTPEDMAAMALLAQRMEETVPYLSKLTWLGNAEHITGTEEGMEVNDFFDPLPETDAELQAAFGLALSEPSYVNSIISPDTRTLAMVMELEKYPEGVAEPRKEIVPAVYSILEGEEFRQLGDHIVGAPVFAFEYDKMVQKEGGLYFLGTLIVQAILLLWFGRGIRGVIVPLAVVIVGVIWTIGAIGLLGITVNLLTMALPTILICVGIGDSIHIIAGYQDYSDHGTARKPSLRESLRMSGKAIFLTSLTTAAGFMAFLSTHVPPYREMGVYVALGVMFTFVLSVILVPIGYSFGRAHPKRRKTTADKPRQDVFDRLLAGICNLNVRHPVLVMSFFLVVSAVSVWGITKLEIESDTIKLLDKSSRLRQSIDIVDERMGGAMYAELMIDTGREDGIKDADFLKKMDQLQEHIEAHPLTTSTRSVLDVLKKTRKALHNDDPSFYTVPESDQAAAQYLFLYESSGGDTMDKLVSFDSSVVRLNSKTKVLTTGTGRGYQDYIMDYAHDLFDGQATVKASGGLYRYMSLNDILSEGQKSSFLAAFIAIGVIMMLLMRSFGLGGISMIPNVFPVLVSLGFMGLAGMYLDVITMSFSAVIIGVAVDDTIHFFTRYRHEFNVHGDYETALRRTMGSVGRAILFTTVTLTIGFAPFMFSSLLGFQKLGLLMGFAFTWALLADLFFSPALILLTKPLGKEPARQQGA